MPSFNLTTNGVQYEGWKEISVTRSMEAVSGGFDLRVSDLLDVSRPSYTIKEGDECAIYVEGQQVITGYIDSRSVSYGKQSHELSVTGRDKAADLVDSSVNIGKWQFLNQDVLSICKELAAPFAVPVTLGEGVTLPKPLKKFAINPGESSFEAIDRACRMAALLPVSDGMGGIVLGTGSNRVTSGTRLEEGRNILEASGKYSLEGRFYKYICSGQHAGDDDINGTQASAVQAQAIDAGVRQSRVLMVRAEGIVTKEAALRRANWEARVRLARAGEVSVKVQGWMQDSGEIWKINQLVPLYAPMLSINADMLISEVNFSLDDNGGSITNLSLRNPDAYLPEPLEEKKTKDGAASTGAPYGDYVDEEL